MPLFLSESSLTSGSWQAFERAVCRLLLHEGFQNVRLIGATGDRGADVLASKNGKRWLLQVKHWKNRIGVETVDRTLDAANTYRAQVPAIVSLNGFDDKAREAQRALMSRGTPLQLWDKSEMVKRAARLPEKQILARPPRDYQEEAIQDVARVYFEGASRRAMVVMATGLGKTFTAGEAVRRMGASRPLRVLVLAHTNEIVYQLERAFWAFLTPSQETLIWNGYEAPSSEAIERAPFVFACLNSAAGCINSGGTLPGFDVVVVDECHHVGGEMYEAVLEDTRAGKPGGPFLLGLTATPWRPDDTDLSSYFGEPLSCIDMVTGLRRGFLSNVDYRMYTDNINWPALANLKGSRFSPRQINRTLFISEWDDAVILELQKVWREVPNPRAIVFCGTIDHAITTRDRLNSLGFCNAAAIYSGTQAGHKMEGWERNRILCDFGDGAVNVVCAIDIFNEGVDVPDVNILVFQRVTHSRRIFIQQLGRGLRLSPGKEKVVVLDFVSDIRRFAAGLDLKKSLESQDEHDPAPGRPKRIRLPHKVTFKRAGGDDPQSETFLRQWLDDVAAIEGAGEDTSVLKFPPPLPGGKA